MSMVMRGRKSKPTAIKRLEGNPGKRPMQNDKSLVLKQAPCAPDWLLPGAAQAWERAARVFVAIKMLSQFDLVALAACCQSYAQWRIALRQSEEYSEMPDYDRKQNPYISISSSYWKCFASLCREFGLSSVDFLQISDVIQPDAEDNSLELHLSGRG